MNRALLPLESEESVWPPLYDLGMLELHAV